MSLPHIISLSDGDMPSGGDAVVADGMLRCIAEARWPGETGLLGRISNIASWQLCAISETKQDGEQPRHAARRGQGLFPFLPREVPSRKGRASCSSLADRDQLIGTWRRTRMMMMVV